MLSSTIARSLWRVLVLALIASGPALPAEMSGVLKTRTVVLIVSDGLRWQEIFTGADPELLNEKNGGIWETERELRREFWRTDPAERRQALFPFLWGTVAVRGQIFGNQTQGSIAGVTTGLAFSYPGYNEMLTGHRDARINSNEFGPNPTLPVFEWLNGLPELHGHVAVYATWGAFKDIFNVGRSHLPVQAGWDPPYRGTTSAREELLNRLYRATTPLEGGDGYNTVLQVPPPASPPAPPARVPFLRVRESRPS